MAREVFVLRDATKVVDRVATDTIVYDKKILQTNVTASLAENITPKVGQIHLSASLSGLTSSPTTIACYKIKEIIDGDVYLVSCNMPTGVVKQGTTYYKVSPATYYKATELNIADLM